VVAAIAWWTVALLGPAGEANLHGTEFKFKHHSALCTSQAKQQPQQQQQLLCTG
jgi:hypothetical protein